MTICVDVFDPLRGERERRRFASVPVVIGRDRRCDLVLDHDFVSGRHAELRRGSGGELLFVDLGSSNGTHRGGERLTPAQPLRVDTRLVVTIGHIELDLAEERVLAGPTEADIATVHALLRRLRPLFSAWVDAAESARAAQVKGLAALSPAARELAEAMIARDLPRCE